MTRILSAFNFLKWVRFAVLLLGAASMYAQPYEPTFLLDVTGEVDERVGAFFMQSVGDQDGDGNDDFLTTRRSSPNSVELRLYFGNDSQQSDFLTFGRFDTTNDRFGWSDAAFDAGFTVPAGDINGDGFQDILLSHYRQSAGAGFRPVLFLGAPTVFDTVPDWAGTLTDLMYITNVGDYNGDGRDDYTSRPLSAQYFGLFLGSEPPLSQVYEWDYLPNRAHMGFGDVNGDGFSDFGMSYFIGSMEHAETDVFLGSPEADSIPDIVIQRDTGDIEWNGRIVGDINGDSFDDIMTQFSSWSIGQRWFVYYGGTNMDTEIDETFIWGNGLGAPGHVTPLGDINADGIGDFAFYTGPNDNHIEVWLGGNPLPRSAAWVLDGPLDGMNYPYRIGEAGDFNGDGIDDWFFSAYHGLEERGRIIVVAGDRDFGVSVDDHPTPMPSAFTLHSCYPNPFNSSVTIPLEILGTGTQNIKISIFNTLGQSVYRFDQEQFTPGLHNLRWDGRSNQGVDITSGLYFLTAFAANTRLNMKLLLIK